MNERKLRIAQVAPLWASIPPATYGGIELIVHLLTNELVRRGHDVTLFASGDSRTDAKLRAVCDENVMALMEKNGASLYEYYANSAAADALRNPDEFDIVHFHAGNSLVPVASLVRTTTVFTMHTFPSADEKWMFARYPNANIVGISRDQVSEFSRIRGREVPVVYNGIDCDRFDPTFGRGEYLAFLGRLSHDKNPLDAIRVAKKVGMPLVLAGRPQNSKEEKYFAENVQQHLDGKNVRWIGPVNHAQKNELLRHAAALLFPVQWPEPFGLVMVEAMACGTPVVARTWGSVVEVVEQGVTGFHAEEIDDLAALVPKAIELDRRRIRERVCERFSYATMVDNYVALYRSLLR